MLKFIQMVIQNLRYPSLDSLISEDELIESENDIRKYLDLSYSYDRNLSEKIYKLFLAFDIPLRRRRYFLLGLIALLIFNLLIISDYLTTPDIFKIALTVRVLIISPVILILLFSILLLHSAILIENFASFGCLLITFTQIFLIEFSNYTYIAHLNSGFFIIPVFFNIVLRLRFKFALAYSLIIMLIYFYLNIILTPTHIEFIVNSFIVLFVAITFSLIGNFQMEKEYRRNTLFAMLQKIDSLKLKKSNKELMLLSNSDSLTGLSNRRFFDAALEKEWRNVLRKKLTISLIFIDIDFFKLYNDNYGHQEGDKCLKIIAKTLNKFARRPHDVCARYGGEEFVILLPELNISEVLQVAEKIRTEVMGLKIKHEFSTAAKIVTISLGVAEAKPFSKNNKLSLIEKADKALYMAKSGGRNKVCSIES